MRKKEWVLLVSLTILIVLVAGQSGIYNRPIQATAGLPWITQDGRLVERIDLQRVREPRQITLPGKYHEVVEVEPGRIRFKQADCPDKICVNTGWLEDPGTWQSACPTGR